MRGMVVAPEPLAAQAGVDVLALGGNAVDAAIAAGFVQGVVNPLLCGVGGSGLMLVHHASSDRSFLVDGSCTVGSVPPPATWASQARGRSEAYGRYILASEANQYGYRSIMVPGFVRGAWVAFQAYGSGVVSWADLLATAERHASEGFEVDPYISAFWRSDEDRPAYPSLTRKLEHAAAESATYGIPRAVGEVFTQATYGRTLRRLATAGGDDFYGGGIADEMTADLVANGSLITASDVSGYTAPESPPLVGSYRGVEIRAAVSGSSSSPQVLAMLQILEGFDVAAMEPNSPAYIDVLARVMRAGFVDHLQLKCDPPFSVGMELLAAFTSKARAAYWQERVRHERVRGPETATGLGSDTTHLSVTDEAGNAVSWTHTLGSLAGSGVVTPGLGFLYNNFVGHFNPTPGHWDSLLPRKRGGGGSPLLLFRHGKPFMVIGAPGGSRIFTAVLQAIVNVVDHGMDMATAVAVPRFHAEEDDLVYLEPELPDATAKELESMGYRVVRSSYMSRVQAVLIDPETGRFSAGADPRGGGGQAVIV